MRASLLERVEGREYRLLVRVRVGVGVRLRVKLRLRVRSRVRLRLRLRVRSRSRVRASDRPPACPQFAPVATVASWRSRSRRAAPPEPALCRWRRAAGTTWRRGTLPSPRSRSEPPGG